MKKLWFGGLVAVSTLAQACGPASLTPGKDLEPTKTGEAFEGMQCTAVRPQTEPDLMGWDPGSRANLARLRNEGVVAVRYRSEGCNVELELLSNCIAEGKYTYRPYAATDTKVAHNVQELFAALPIGAARLAGKVGRDKAIRTDYMLVGMASIPPGKAYHIRDLKGTGCGRATHIVTAIYSGGFAVVAGETRTVQGEASVFLAEAGGSHSGHTERIAREGTPAACQEALEKGTESPLCAAPLRIGLAPLDGVTPDCPSGQSWDGSRCASPEPVAVASKTQDPQPATRTSPAPSSVARTAPPAAQPASASAPAAFEPLGPMRETRPGPFRARSLVSTELTGLQRLFASTPKNSPDRVQIARRIAETAAELAVSASQDSAAASSARQTAINHYKLVKDEYPMYSRLDEVLYFLGLEYEISGDQVNARKTYFELIQKVPQSKYIPATYLAFGEMFLKESSADPSKLDLARQAYSEVIKYPPPENRAFAYANYQLGVVYAKQAGASGSDHAKAMSHFKRAIETTAQYSTLPRASLVAASARKDLIRSFAAAGRPDRAWDFFRPLGGDVGSATTGTEKMCLDLAQEYSNDRRYVEGSELLTSVLDQTTSPAACSAARRQVSEHTAASSSAPVARTLSNKVSKRCGSSPSFRGD